MGIDKRNLVAVVVLLWAGATSFAQNGDVERFQRQVEQIRRETRVQVDSRVPPGQRTFVDYGLYLTPSYLSVDDSVGDAHGLRQLDAVGYARLSVDGVHDLFFRARGTYRDFNEGDTFDADGRNQFWKTRVERAAYRFSLQRYVEAYQGQSPDSDLTFTAGRQLAIWGNGLVLNQDVDGAQVDLSVAGKLTFSVLAARTAPYTIDFDASRPNFDDDTKRLFVGGMVSTTLGRHRPYVYFLSQTDQNADTPVVIPIGGDLGVVSSFQYQSQYLAVGSSGALGDRLLYGIEAALEFGTSRSRVYGDTTSDLVGQTDDPIRAAAMDVRLDYLFDSSYQTRASAELIIASGDDDRQSTSNTVNGNAPGTTDRAFNAFGLLNTGVAFAPSVSNLLMARVGASTFPFAHVSHLRKLEVGVDVFVYNKLRSAAPIDQETTDQRYLGFEPDLFLNWPITSDVSLALRYGIFFPGRALTEVDGADDSPRHFFYTGVTFAF